MRRSADRILTTHTGSLPRPRDLVALLQDREEGRAPAAPLPGIVWHKLRSLVEGARLASAALW